MKLFNLIKTFSNDESGAVTVDWVVLTAAIVGLGIAVVAAVSTGVRGLGGNIETALDSTVPVINLDGLHD
jgi:Flp pilus assembly pilin Flp